MSNHLAPFHFDIVGSFLRPAELKEARQAFTDGKITREDLTAVEDRLITDLIKNKSSRSTCDYRWRVPPCILAFRFHVGIQWCKRN